MQSVTSNAVADAFGTWERVWTGASGNNFIDGIETYLGKFLRIRLSGYTSGYIANSSIIITVTNNKWKPTIEPNRFIIGVDTTTVRMNAGIDFETSGNMRIYFQGNTPLSGGETVTGLFCDLFFNLR